LKEIICKKNKNNINEPLLTNFVEIIFKIIKKLIEIQIDGDPMANLNPIKKARSIEI
jgi:hypothetical protein